MINTINTDLYGTVEIKDEIARGAREEATAKPAGINFTGAAAPIIQVNGTQASQANSVAGDVAGVVADLNTLLGNLRTVGILAT